MPVLEQKTHIADAQSGMFLYLQFIFEGMEESGSEGLDELVFSKKDTFLKVILPFLCSYLKNIKCYKTFK